MAGLGRVFGIRKDKSYLFLCGNSEETLLVYQAIHTGLPAAYSFVVGKANV